MEDVLVTIIGFNRSNPGIEKVSVGSKVLLQKEPDNQYDTDAVQVFLEDGSETVGYVANKSTTIHIGTKRATEIKDTFVDTIYAEITSTSPRQQGIGFVAKLLNQEFENNETLKTGRENQMTQEYRVKIKGSKSIYPNKYLVADEIKKGITTMVKLERESDKVVAYFNGGRCGYVETRSQEGISTYDEIKDLIEGEVIATIDKMVRQDYIATFTVGEAQIQKALAVNSVGDTFERIINENILTQSEIDKRVTYLKANNVTPKQMNALFQSMKKYDDEIAKRIPSPKTLYKDSAGIVKKTIAYMNVKRNLLFEGDRGVGKNVLTETLAWVFNRPLFEFPMNSQHDNNSMLGSKTFTTEVGEDGKERTQISFDPDVIVQAGEVGGILVLDEFNTSFGHVMSLLNSYLDDRRRLQVPGYQTVELDPNTMVIATQNRDYQGTFETNEATIDRFVPIIFPQMNSIQEVLLSKVPGVSIEVLDTCQKLYEGLKKCVTKGEISDKTISIRGFIDACLVTEQDIPLKDSLIDNISNRAVDTDERKSINNMIDMVCG